MNPRILRKVAMQPGLFTRHILHGQPVQTVRPSSPLLSLLDMIAPRDRMSIRALHVDAALGYGGSRLFHNAQQAMLWLRPHDEVLAGETWPAESCRIRSFNRRLYLDDLAGNCAQLPQQLLARYPGLRAPGRSR